MSDDDFLRPGAALRGPIAARLLQSGSPTPPQAGERIGPYRIVREIGRGGMGVVFLGERADGVFAQQVAVKCVPPAALDEATDARSAAFAREREVLAGLDHPAIARLIDGGRTSRGWAWFAMEYVDGLRLDVHARERGLGLRERVALLLPLCEAVAFAHRRLVIHRDIKSSNAMVSRDGQVKLLDFGIAALDGEAASGASAMTPAWASPEQRRREPVTTASDIHQLGRVLAWLAAGAAGATRVSEDLSGTHLRAPAVAPPDAGALADADLRAIVARATADLPEQRYAAATALADDLAAWLQRRPVAARGGGPAYRLGRLLVRRPWTSAAVIAAGAGLVALGAALLVQRAAVQREAERASAEAAAAQREAARSRAAVQFLGELLANAEPGVHRGQVPTVEDALAAGAARLRATEDMPATLRGELLARLGAIHIERSEFGAARGLLAIAVPLLRGPGVETAVLGEALGNLAYTLDYADSARALPLMDEGIALLARDPAQVPARLRLQRLRGSLLYGIGRYPDAIDALRAHLDEAARVLGDRAPEAAMSRVLLAMSLNASGQTELAMVQAERGWTDLRAALGAAHPRTVQAGNAYASALHNHQRFAEQVVVLDRLLDDGTTLWGGAHPRIALLLTWKGAGLLGLGRYGDAAAALERAEAIYTAADPEDDLGSPNTLAVLGDAYAGLGRVDAAMDAWQRMYARERERTTALPPDDGNRALRPARLLVRLGRHAEARAHLDEALSRARRTTPPAAEGHRRGGSPARGRRGRLSRRRTTIPGPQPPRPPCPTSTSARSNPTSSPTSSTA